MIKKNILKLKKRNPKIFNISLFSIAIVLLAGVGVIFASNPPVFSNIEFTPPLDISRFGNYQVTANIEGLPNSETANVTLTGINGDGNSPWNYYANGAPLSDAVTKIMNYDLELEKWKSSSIYPDSIYPEIFFAPSEVTWNNVPQNTIIRRNNYHIMNFKNNFTPTGDMSFWIEVNAYRRSSVNSANLDVYLVESGHDITYFQSDWRSKQGVELVGSISKDANFNHTHTANSSHHLVALSANSDGTFGTKKLDISGDFWILLYSQSPNDARGFDLRYHPSSLCDSGSGWYIGSQAGWSTTLQSGCPDAHIHLARRSAEGGIRDGVRLVTTASYDGETGTKTTNLYYNELPNLAPNTTSFINPTVGGTYSGDVSVSWNPASDPNNDPLKYDLYLLDEDNQQVGSALLTESSSTSYTLQTTIPGQEIPNGNYSLKGVVCDQGVPTNEPPDAPLCTDFLLPGTFYVDNSNPIRSISSITLSSNNANTTYAKAGDTVTLSFVSSGSLNSPTVNLYSDGTTPINDVALASPDNVNWTASYLVSAQANSGEVSFEITSTDLDRNYYDTTDDTRVSVDVINPAVSSFSPDNGSDKNTLTSNLILVLDEPIQVVAGKNLTIKKAIDDSVFEVIDLSAANVTVNGASITIDPSGQFADKTQYYALVDAGSFMDGPGNLFAGISEKSAWAFTVGDITPPQLSSVTISSNNPNPSFANTGDIITILIEANEVLLTPSFDVKINGNSVVNPPVITNISGNMWTAVFEVSEADGEGLVSFAIDFFDISDNAGTQVVATTNGSTVSVIGETAPSVTVTSTEVVLSSPTPTISSIPISTVGPSTTSTTLSSSQSISANPLVTATSVIGSASTESIGSSIKTFPSATATYGPVEDLYNLEIKILEGQRPLAGVAVELYSVLRKGVTDVDGVVEFPNVEPGIHRIKIFYGKNIVEKEIAVTGAERQIIFNINVQAKTSRAWIYYSYGIPIFLIGLIIFFLSRRKRRQKTN